VNFFGKEKHLDKPNFTLEVEPRQGLRGVPLSHSDRRVLLISSLTLFLWRARHGYPITSEDLVRLASYGDATDSTSVERAA
jgi:hypothetical protein